MNTCTTTVSVALISLDQPRRIVMDETVHCLNCDTQFYTGVHQPVAWMYCPCCGTALHQEDENRDDEGEEHPHYGSLGEEIEE